MPLHTTGELLEAAVAGRTGLAAFNVITLEYAEAIVAGAAAAGRPVILQLSENATRFHGGDPRPVDRGAAPAGRGGGGAGGAAPRPRHRSRRCSRRAPTPASAR